MSRAGNAPVQGVAPEAVVSELDRLRAALDGRVAELGGAIAGDLRAHRRRLCVELVRGLIGAYGDELSPIRPLGPGAHVR